MRDWWLSGPHFSLQLLPALGIFHFLNTNELEREEAKKTDRQIERWDGLHGSPSTLTPVEIMRWPIGAVETASVLLPSDIACDNTGVQWRLSPCHPAKPGQDESRTAGTSATSFPALIKKGLWDPQNHPAPLSVCPLSKMQDHCIYIKIMLQIQWILCQANSIQWLFCLFKWFS